MPWAYRASSYADDGAGFNINNPTGGTLASHLQLGTTAVLGDRTVVNIICGATSGQFPTLAVSDSNGSYTQDATQTWTDTGVGIRHSVFSRENVAATRPTISVVVSGTTSGSQFGGIQIAAYSGLITTTPGSDVTGAGQASSTSATATTAATTAGSELIIGAYTDLGYNCTLAAGSGFTSRGSHPNDGSAWQGLFEDKLGGSSGATETATATPGATATWGMLAVVYKIVAGPQDTPELYASPRLSARQMTQLLAQ